MVSSFTQFIRYFCSETHSSFFPLQLCNIYTLHQHLVNRPLLRLPYPLVIQIGSQKLETPIHRGDLETVSNVLTIKTSLCYAIAIWRGTVTGIVLQMEIIMSLMAIYGCGVDTLGNIRNLHSSERKLKFLFDNLALVGHTIACFLYLCHYQKMFCWVGDDPLNENLMESIRK